MKPIQDREIKTKGVVLASFNSGERDKLLRVLSTDLGKITIIAKSCRGPQTKSWKHTPELFDSGQLLITPPRSGDIYQFKRNSSLNSNHKLIKRIDTMVLGTLLCEIIDKLTTDHHHEDGQLFPLLLNSLNQLGETKNLKSCLQSAYSSILSILRATGFHAPLGTQTQGSSKRLTTILQHIEQLASTSLNSHSSVDQLLQQLKRQEA